MNYRADEAIANRTWELGTLETVTMANAQSEPMTLSALRPGRWWFALFGQYLFVFAILALTGPGRIDITDGQVRYEVARGLVEVGDPAIRDPELWFSIFPGRHGRRYSDYRLPQSVLGIPAILLADATGPTTECRRHFFFVLTSAAVGALLAVIYSMWFRAMGQVPRAALLWATAGIFCTPNWFYSTSTFDDILGAAALVPALALALLLKPTRPLLGAMFSGLLVGLAFNCKQPLGVFALPALVAVCDSTRSWKSQLPRMALLLLCFALGVAVHVGYQYYKFPQGLAAARAPFARDYVNDFVGSPVVPLVNLVHLTISPSAGVFWYCPTLLLSLFGLSTWWRRERPFCVSLLFAVAVFVAFICCLTYFKGDPAWGPRYLTPVFAALWLFAPAGVAVLGLNLTRLVLVAGFVVQLLGLSIDPHRLYFEHRLPSAFYHAAPWLYLDARIAHLPNRPREILEVIISPHEAEQYSPASAPTYGFPVMEDVYDVDTPGRVLIRRYRVLNSFRPWWASMRWLPPSARPVDLNRTVAFLLIMAGAGLALLAGAFRFGRA